MKDDILMIPINFHGFPYLEIPTSQKFVTWKNSPPLVEAWEAVCQLSTAMAQELQLDDFLGRGREWWKKWWLYHEKMLEIARKLVEHGDLTMKHGGKCWFHHENGGGTW